MLHTVGTTLRSALRRLRARPLHKPNISLPFVFIGTEYGGWPLLKDTHRGEVIYSFGVGEDISFDLGAIKTFGCRVLAFDPTPKSCHWITKQVGLPSQFSFHPIGIAGHDGDATFFPPANKQHVSFSVNSDQRRPAGDIVVAKVQRLASIIVSLGAPPPDILKMDIEGFEYDVISDFSSDLLRPRQLLVEFHHGQYGFDADHTRAAVSKVRAAGYRLFYVSLTGHEYGFVRS